MSANLRDTETILLLHGIWMHPVIMSKLAGSFTAQGYRVLNIAYPSLRCSPPENARLVYQQLTNHQPSSHLHIVAHSLGGIVALHLLANYELPTGQLLTLGSPVQGSELASRIGKWPLVRSVLGQSMECGLSGEAIPEGCSRNWGMIAGNKAVGLAMLTGGFSGMANDGTVLVEETYHPDIDHHMVLPVSHTGMLFAQSVVDQASYFLKHSEFSPAPRET